MNWLKHVLIVFGPLGSLFCIFHLYILYSDLHNKSANTKYQISSYPSLNHELETPWVMQSKRVKSNNIYNGAWESIWITYRSRERHDKILVPNKGLEGQMNEDIQEVEVDAEQTAQWHQKWGP